MTTQDSAIPPLSDFERRVRDDYLDRLRRRFGDVERWPDAALHKLQGFLQGRIAPREPEASQ